RFQLYQYQIKQQQRLDLPYQQQLQLEQQQRLNLKQYQVLQQQQLDQRQYQIRQQQLQYQRQQLQQLFYQVEQQHLQELEQKKQQLQQQQQQKLVPKKYVKAIYEEFLFVRSNTFFVVIPVFQEGLKFQRVFDVMEVDIDFLIKATPNDIVPITFSMARN
ncbi:hypothetical protein DICPUDRAFT_160234, partial [Dictyostelium purpureum]